MKRKTLVEWLSKIFDGKPITARPGMTLSEAWLQRWKEPLVTTKPKETKVLAMKGCRDCMAESHCAADEICAKYDTKLHTELTPEEYKKQASLAGTHWEILPDMSSNDVEAMRQNICEKLDEDRSRQIQALASLNKTYGKMGNAAADSGDYFMTPAETYGPISERRWEIKTTSEPIRTGGDAGSDLHVERFDDNGNKIESNKDLYFKIRCEAFGSVVGTFDSVPLCVIVRMFRFRTDWIDSLIKLTPKRQAFFAFEEYDLFIERVA